VGADTFTDVRDSRSSDEELLWAGDSSESDEVDVLALMDALDSGTGISQSSRDRSSAAISSNDSVSDGEMDYESHRVVDSDSLASRGRAWAESVAMRSATLPGAVDVAHFDQTDHHSISQPISSPSSHRDHCLVVEDVSETSDSSGDEQQLQHLPDQDRNNSMMFAFREENVQAHRLNRDHDHMQQQDQQQQSQQPTRPPPENRQLLTASSLPNYHLSAAFQFSRSRALHSDLPQAALPSSSNQRDVTLNLAFTRASLAAPSSHEQLSRYGGQSSAFDMSYRERAAPDSDPNVMPRFHLPGHDIGRSMQALWSLQV
jgi:hypothetical protein